MVNADLIFRNLAEELVHVGDARGLVLQEPTVAIQYRSLQIYNSDLRIQIPEKASGMGSNETTIFQK